MNYTIVKEYILVPEEDIIEVDPFNHYIKNPIENKEYYEIDGKPVEVLDMTWQEYLDSDEEIKGLIPRKYKEVIGISGYYTGSFTYNNP